MTPADRDWDKELAEIDKVIARAPAPAATPGGPPQVPAATQPGKVAMPSSTRKAVLGTWLQVVLGGLLAVGMTQWPYPRECGIRLFLYLGAAGVVILAGLWGARSTWRRHLAGAHAIALLVTLAGLVLVALEVLPRTGYARDALTWMCP